MTILVDITFPTTSARFEFEFSTFEELLDALSGADMIKTADGVVVNFSQALYFREANV
jgi:hypothetical protein